MARMRFPGRPAVKPDRGLVLRHADRRLDDASLLKSVVHYFGLGFGLFESVRTARDEDEPVVFRNLDCASLLHRLRKIDRLTGVESDASKAANGLGTAKSDVKRSRKRPSLLVRGRGGRPAVHSAGAAEAAKVNRAAAGRKRLANAQPVVRKRPGRAAVAAASEDDSSEAAAALPRRPVASVASSKSKTLLHRARARLRVAGSTGGSDGGGRRRSAASDKPAKRDTKQPRGAAAAVPPVLSRKKSKLASAAAAVRPRGRGGRFTLAKHARRPKSEAALSSSLADSAQTEEESAVDEAETTLSMKGAEPDAAASTADSKKKGCRRSSLERGGKEPSRERASKPSSSRRKQGHQQRLKVKLKVKLKMKPKSVVNAKRSKMHAMLGSKARSRLSRSKQSRSQFVVGGSSSSRRRKLLAVGGGLSVADASLVPKHRRESKFVLPHVSVRSSRKIVPTKRFIEEYEGDEASARVAAKRCKLEGADGSAAAADDLEGSTSASGFNTANSQAETGRRSSITGTSTTYSGTGSAVAGGDPSALSTVRSSSRIKRERGSCSVDEGLAAAADGNRSRVDCDVPAESDSFGNAEAESDDGLERRRRRHGGRPVARSSRKARAEAAAAAAESGSARPVAAAATAAATAILVKAKKRLTCKQKKALRQAAKLRETPVAECIVCARSTQSTYFGLPACKTCKRFYQRYVVRPLPPERLRSCRQGPDVPLGQCQAMLLPQEDYCPACHFARCVAKFPYSNRLKMQAAILSAEEGRASSADRTAGRRDVGDASDALVTNSGSAKVEGVGVSEPAAAAGSELTEMDYLVPQSEGPLSTTMGEPGSSEMASSMAVRTVSEGGPRIKHVCRSANVAQGTPARYSANSVSDIRLSALPPDEKSAILRQDEENGEDDDDDDDDDHGDRRRVTRGGDVVPIALPYSRNTATDSKASVLVVAGAGDGASVSGGQAERVQHQQQLSGGRPTSRKGPSRMRRCEQCENCKRPCCGRCPACKNMIKFGGPGTLKKSCQQRNCLTPVINQKGCVKRARGRKRPAHLTPDASAASAAEASGGAIAAVSTAADEASSQNKDAASVDESLTAGKGREIQMERVKMGVPLSVITPASAGHVQRISMLEALQDEAIHRVFVDIKADCFDMSLMWQHGSALIFSTAICSRTLCYLCGSSGNFDFLFCAVCCEPFHEFCLEENEKPKAEELDWVCRKCQFCATCGLLGNLLKCARCSDSYHGSCLSAGHPSKLTRSGTWVCSRCVRCKSCGTTTPGTAPGARWTDDFSLCYDCGKLKAKGNMCPICECCYADDDWDSKMVQCSGCNSWVHAKCEHISDEVYEIMSGLPDDEAPYQCRDCCAAAAAGGDSSCFGGVVDVASSTARLPWLQTIAGVLQRLLRRVIGALLSLKCAQHLVHSAASSRADTVSLGSTALASAEAPSNADVMLPILTGQQAECSSSCRESPDRLLTALAAGHEANDMEHAAAAAISGSELLNDGNEVAALPSLPAHEAVAALLPLPPLIDGSGSGVLVPPADKSDCEAAAVQPLQPVDDGGATVIDQSPTGRMTDAAAADVASRSPCTGAPSDFSSVARLVDEGKYDRVLTFAEDVVQIINGAFENEKFQLPVFSQYNHIVQYTFIKEMQLAFPWFDVKSEKLWASTAKVHSSPSKDAATLSGSGIGRNSAKEDDSRPDDDDAAGADDDGTAAGSAAVEDSMVTDPAMDAQPAGTSSVDAAVSADTLADRRRCVLCAKYGDGLPEDAGRLLYAGQDEWVHLNCAMWSAEVFEEVDGTLQNVQAAFTRGRQLECEHCHYRGATVGCCLRGCSANFHFMCARLRGCAFQDDKKMFCFRHVRHVDGLVIHGSKFCVSRTVTIDFREAKVSKKAWQQGLLPKDIRVSIGSLFLDNLGRLTALSDSQSLLLPVGYSIKRTFWSTVNPFKRCVYTCRIIEVKPPPEERPADVVIQEMTINHDERLPNYVSPADLHKVLPAICRPKPLLSAVSAQRKRARVSDEQQRSGNGGNKKKKKTIFVAASETAASSGAARFAPRDKPPAVDAHLPATGGTPAVAEGSSVDLPSDDQVERLGAPLASILQQQQSSAHQPLLPAVPTLASGALACGTAATAMLNAVSAARSSGAFASSWPGSAMMPAPARPAARYAGGAPQAANSLLSQSWPLPRQKPAVGTASTTTASVAAVDLNRLSEKTRRQLGGVSLINQMSGTAEDDPLEDISTLTLFARKLNKAAAKNSRTSGGATGGGGLQGLPALEEPARSLSRGSSTDTASGDECMDEPTADEPFAGGGNHPMSDDESSPATEADSFAAGFEGHVAAAGSRLGFAVDTNGPVGVLGSATSGSAGMVDQFHDPSSCTGGSRVDDSDIVQTDQAACGLESLPAAVTCSVTVASIAHNIPLSVMTSVATGDGPAPDMNGATRVVACNDDEYCSSSGSSSSGGSGLSGGHLAVGHGRSAVVFLEPSVASAQSFAAADKSNGPHHVDESAPSNGGLQHVSIVRNALLQPELERNSAAVASGGSNESPATAVRVSAMSQNHASMGLPATTAIAATTLLPSPLLTPPKIVITDFSSRGIGDRCLEEGDAEDLRQQQQVAPVAATAGSLPCSDSTRDKLLRTLVRRKSDPTLVSSAVAAPVAAASDCDVVSGALASGRVMLGVPAAASALLAVAAPAIQEPTTCPSPANDAGCPESLAPAPWTGVASAESAAAEGTVLVSPAPLDADVSQLPTVQLFEPSSAAAVLTGVTTPVAPLSTAVLGTGGGCAILGNDRPDLAICQPTPVAAADAVPCAAAATACEEPASMAKPPADSYDKATAGDSACKPSALLAAVGEPSHRPSLPAVDSGSLLAGRPRLQSLLAPQLDGISTASNSSAIITAPSSTRAIAGGCVSSSGRVINVVSLLDRQYLTSTVSAWPSESCFVDASGNIMPASTQSAYQMVNGSVGGSNTVQPLMAPGVDQSRPQLQQQQQHLVCLLRQVTMPAAAATPATTATDEKNAAASCCGSSRLPGPPELKVVVANADEASAAATAVATAALSSSHPGSDPCAKKTYLGSLHIMPNGQIIGLDQLNLLATGKSSYRLNVTQKLVHEVSSAAKNLALPGGCSVVVQVPDAAAAPPGALPLQLHGQDVQTQRQDLLQQLQLPSTAVRGGESVQGCSENSSSAAALANAAASAAAAAAIAAAAGTSSPSQLARSSTAAGDTTAAGAVTTTTTVGNGGTRVEAFVAGVKRSVVTVTASPAPSLSVAAHVKRPKTDAGSGLLRPGDVISGMGPNRLMRTITYPRGVSPAGHCNGGEPLRPAVHVMWPRPSGRGGGALAATSVHDGKAQQPRQASTAVGRCATPPPLTASQRMTLAGLGNATTVPVNIDKWIRETAAARNEYLDATAAAVAASALISPAAAIGAHESEDSASKASQTSSGGCGDSGGSGSRLAAGNEVAVASATPSVAALSSRPTTVGPYRKAKVIGGGPSGNKQQQQQRAAERNMSRLMFEITSEDGFSTQADCYADAWKAVVNAVQEARQHWTASNPGSARRRALSFAAVKGATMYGLDHFAVVRLIEQLYGARLCRKYQFKHFRPAQIEIEQEPPENVTGCARSEVMLRPRPPFEMFAFLHSQYRTMRTDLSKQNNDVELAQKSSRRATSMELPVAMRYRALQQKNHAKEAVGVYRSSIHGRGLFCMRPIDAGEMIIEYAGEVIRSSLTDVREKYYESKGIGCYMFRIDEFEVVDATLRGNASRFINHCCEPNCYSRIITAENKKHIVIYASRAIKPGEELTYDYKFPFEEVKIPCNCGVRKCRKYLN